MLMLLYSGLAVAALFFVGAIGFYLYARRISSSPMLSCGQSELELRRRAVLDDFGDGAVWEMGQRAKAAHGDALPVEQVTTSRRLLPLLSASVLILIARRGAARARRKATGGTKALAWEKGHPERRVWSDELRRAIRGQIDSLEQARDIEDFAPGYEGFSTEERVDVWAGLFVAIARFETVPAYDATSVYRERSVPGHPQPIESVGLFQLSYENQTFYGLEPLDRKTKSLEDPLVNLRCAVTIMAFLVRRDGVIASGSASSARGGARYWSSLWPSGHLADIHQIVRRAAPTPQRRPHIDTPHGDHYDSH